MRCLFIGIILLFASALLAQNDLYHHLNSFISNQTKEKTENRLIAVNLWSLNDKTSRELNLEFEKTYKAFEYAKLKGGYKGIIVMNLNLDNDVVSADITLKKDGISKLIKVSLESTDILLALQGKTSGYNIVFDEKGNLVYENLKPGTVFNTIQKLITR